jgi:EmrB/QacA subfamily drug resistance transporter
MATGTQADKSSCASLAASGHRPIAPDGHAAKAAVCTSPCEERSRPFVLAATILASAMAFIDGSVVTIALPAIQAGFQTSFAAAQWIVNAYALFLGGLILIGGGAGDRFGRRRMFILGIGLFAIASIICAIAPDIETLIAARALKGIGAALLVPQSLAIIAASFPKGVRGRAIGIWAGASAITTALGPAVGGLLIDAFSWRAVFWINLPFCVTAVWLAIRHVPESRDESITGKLDAMGGFLGVAAFGLLTVGLTRLAGSPASTFSTSVIVALGFLLLSAFVLQERRAQSPLMPLSLFENPAFTGANLVTLFLYGALTGVLFLLPFDLIERRDMSATAVGLTLLPFGLIIGLLSGRAGALGDRFGTRPMLVIGSLLVAVASAGLGLRIGGFWTAVFGPIVLLSVGMAVVVAPLTTTVMNSAPDEQSGAASGINNAASRLAGLLSVALIGALATLVFRAMIDGSTSGGERFGALPDVGDATRSTLESAFDRAYSVSMWMTCSWGLLAAAVSAKSLRGKQGKTPA